MSEGGGFFPSPSPIGGRISLGGGGEDQPGQAIPVGPGGALFPIVFGDLGTVAQQEAQAQQVSNALFNVENLRRRIRSAIPGAGELSQLQPFRVADILPASVGLGSAPPRRVRALPTLPGTPGPPRRPGPQPTQQDANVIALVQFLSQLAALLFRRRQRTRRPPPQPGIRLSFQLPQFQFPGLGLPGTIGAGPGGTVGGPMAQVPIFQGGGAFGIGGEQGGLGGILNQGIDLIQQVLLGQGSQPIAMPGGAPTLPSISTSGGVITTGGGIPGVDIVPEGGTCIFPRTTMSTRLPSRVDIPNGRGQFVTFKNMGRPILWTGDLAASKRVRKVASRAKRAGGR